MGGEYTVVVKKVAGLLEQAGIPYLITGSEAVAVFGLPRHSADVDVAVRATRAQVKRVLESNGLSLVLGSAEYRDMLVFESTEHIRVDIWFTPEIPWEVAAFDRRIPIEVGGEMLWFVSPEDLLIRKLWRYSRERHVIDLEDVRSILATTTDLDSRYLEEIAGVTRTLPLLRQLLTEAQDARAARP